jgi:hypothetical protein
VSERGAFFESGAVKAKAPPSRASFFAGEDIQLDEPEQKHKPILKARGKGYMDAEAMRGADIVADAGNIPAGFNRGVTALAGLPMDTATSVADLGGMAYGAARGAIEDRPAGEFYEPYDRSQVPGTGDWFAQQLDSSPLGPATQPTSDTGIGRVLYGAAAGVPGGLIGGGSMVPRLADGVAGGAASAVANELGLDPASQASLSLLAGNVASRATQPVSPKAPPLGPVTETPDQVNPAQRAMNEAAAKQSTGAAGAAVDLQKLSPDLRIAVEKAVQQTGGAVNPEVLARQIQADSLPVKVRLSEGQALGDERLISLELNARGKHEAYSKGFAEQNKALTQNLRVLRDEIGPDVFTTNPVEHADTIISRYKAIDEAANTEIEGKYQALRDAAGGQFPVDAPALLANVRGALKKDLATSKAPSDVMALLEEKAAAGTMTLEDFESLRSSLARTQRSAADGQERHAAGVIRRQIEEMPLQPGAEQLKGLADEARAAARTRFQALEADPAYKAAVTDSVPPDRFVQKFVIGGNRDNVERLSAAMNGDDAAVQTVKVATLEHLRKAAGIDNAYNGNFTQAGYNKALQGLEPKLGFLFDPKTAEAATTLGDVARYTQFQPKGNWVNNSNTDVAAAAREYGKDILIDTLNAKTFGIPFASKIAERMERGKVEKEAAKTFAPGAGLTRLSDLTKLEKK